MFFRLLHKIPIFVDRIVKCMAFMNRKLKIALAALLGFSAACTSVKNAPKEAVKQSGDADTTVVKGYPENPPRIVVMYGVRVPQQDTVRTERLEQLSPATGKPGDAQSPAKK